MAINHPTLSGRKKIRLECEFKNNTLTTRISVSRDLRRYFRFWRFDIRYEDNISAGPGLLHVPAVALLLPLAWITGSEIQISSLDRAFAESAEQLQAEYRKVYPRVPFRTRIIADDWVDSPPAPEAHAVLYSGGMDSTYSYYEYRHERPHLVQVFGTEFPHSQSEFKNLVMSQSRRFAEQNGVEISFVHTSFFMVLDQLAVWHRWWPLKGRANDLWQALGYAVGFLSLAAPLSAGRFNRMVIASGYQRIHPDDFNATPDSSMSITDEKIHWANLGVSHHGAIPRHQKARAMKEWLPGQPLRVCWRFDKALASRYSMNCSHCEKCARTIAALAVAGVDPATCGFVIDDSTLAYMRSLPTRWPGPNSYLPYLWGTTQRAIPEVMEGEMFGLRDFLEWFRELDLGESVGPPPSFWSKDRFFSLAPYPLALVARGAVYRVLGEKRLPLWHDEEATEENRA